MSTELTTQHAAEIGAFDPEDATLAEYLGLNPRDPKSHAMVAICRRYELDPLLKHVVIIPKSGPFITRDGLLHIAHRSGQLDGIVVDEFPSIVDGEWRCVVSVFRRDMGHPFRFPGRYPVNGGNRQYAQEMALKVAESHALRRAFDVNGIPSYDEVQVGEVMQRGEQQATPAQQPARDKLRQAAQRTAKAEPDPISDAQRGKLFALFAEKGIPDAEAQRIFIADVLDREPSTRASLTRADAAKLIDSLERIATDEPVVAEIDEELRAT